MKNKISRTKNAALLLCVVFLATLCLALTGCGDGGSPMGPEETASPPSASEPVSSADSSDPNQVVSTARIVSTGDILIHSPFLTAYYDEDTDTYDFNEIFQYVKQYTEQADYAVANLEVSLGGEAAGEYSGYPCFNCPDAIVDALVNAGFDLLLTANNHIGDTGTDGFDRTQQVLTQKQINWMGTLSNAGDKRYQVIEVNGIKIGMVNYTYITREGDTTYLNGVPISDDFAARLNCFDYNDLDTFYASMEQCVADMKADGAQATILYIHWGEEYHLSPMDYQTTMAQELCNIGFDAIIGGHPHVIEPVEVLTSETTGKKTVCLYSMGNEISNQRHELMTEDIPTAHTEDGLLFYTNFALMGDGSVQLASVDVIPTWVNMYYNENDRRTYEIVPLDKDADWSAFHVSASANGAENAQASYDRTMALVEDGIKAFNALGGQTTSDSSNTSMASSGTSDQSSAASEGTATVIVVSNVA